MTERSVWKEITGEDQISLKQVGAQISHHYFHDMEFNEADLSHARFTRCGFQRCTFNIDLYGTVFNDCVFLNSCFANGYFEKTEFRKSLLAGNDFSNSSGFMLKMVDTRFYDNNVEGVAWKGQFAFFDIKRTSGCAKAMDFDTSVTGFGVLDPSYHLLIYPNGGQTASDFEAQWNAGQVRMRNEFSNRPHEVDFPQKVFEYERNRFIISDELQRAIQDEKFMDSMERNKLKYEALPYIDILNPRNFYEKEVVMDLMRDYAELHKERFTVKKIDNGRCTLYMPNVVVEMKRPASTQKRSRLK